MTFAKDRDLLALEPTLFRDVAWTAQRVATAVNAAVSGTTLTSAGAQFVASGVEAGMVAVVNGAPLEVLEVVNATTLTVSRLREHAGAPAVAPLGATGAELAIYTFLPQVRVVHEQAMRSLGLEPADPEREPGVGDIVNGGALVRVEALGALHLIFSAAAAMVGESSVLWVKSGLYRERFIEERRRVAAEIDLDGDGVPDAVRRLNALQFVRG